MKMKMMMRMRMMMIIMMKMLLTKKSPAEKNDKVPKETSKGIQYNTIQYKNEYYYSGINPVELSKGNEERK